MLVKDFNRKKRKGGKLDYKWKGPYIITKSLGRGLYSLQAEDNSHEISRVNGAHLKKYLSPIHLVSYKHMQYCKGIDINFTQGPAETTTQEDNRTFKDCDSNVRSQSQSISQHTGSYSIFPGYVLQDVSRINCSYIKQHLFLLRQYTFSKLYAIIFPYLGI